MQTDFSLRKPTNLTLDALVLQEARSLGVNLCKVAEAGLHRVVVVAKAAAWNDENPDLLASSASHLDALNTRIVVPIMLLPDENGAEILCRCSGPV